MTLILIKFWLKIANFGLSELTIDINFNRDPMTKNLIPQKTLGALFG